MKIYYFETILHLLKQLHEKVSKACEKKFSVIFQYL